MNAIKIKIDWSPFWVVAPYSNVKSWIRQLLIIVYYKLREQDKNPMDRFLIYRFLPIPILTDFGNFNLTDTDTDFHS